jgi:hypothetical protein
MLHLLVTIAVREVSSQKLSGLPFPRSVPPRLRTAAETRKKMRGCDTMQRCCICITYSIHIMYIYTYMYIHVYIHFQYIFSCTHLTYLSFCCWYYSCFGFSCWVRIANRLLPEKQAAGQIDRDSAESWLIGKLVKTEKSWNVFLVLVNPWLLQLIHVDPVKW